MTNALAIVTADLDFDTTIDSTARLCDEALLMMQQYESHIYQASIVLGAKLQEVKARLPHGAFLPWLETANWEGRTAQRLMMIAKELGPISDTVSHIPRNMLYTIAKLPADQRNNVLTLITDPEHPPLNEIKNRVKEITETETLARRDRKAALEIKRAGAPTDRALKMRANAKAKEFTEQEAREKRKNNLADTLTIVLNLLPDYQRTSILTASHNLAGYYIGEAFTKALGVMTQPATVEPDDSDDSVWKGVSLLDSIMIPTFPRS